MLKRGCVQRGLRKEWWLKEEEGIGGPSGNDFSGN